MAEKRKCPECKDKVEVELTVYGWAIKSHKAKGNPTRTCVGTGEYVKD